MPLTKRASQAVPAQSAAVQAAGISSSVTIVPVAATTEIAATEPKRIGGMRKAGDKAEAPMTKDDYWRRREERDVQRDKDMAWSGMAQAVIDSMAIIQLNTTNTLDGLLDLVERATNSLLERRDRRTG